eukprot:gene12874-3768_t
MEHLSPETLQALSYLNEYSINYELIVQLVAHICTTTEPGGAILVFLPGLAEILTLQEALLNSRLCPFGNPDSFLFICLHSMLSSREQSTIFKQARPSQRKIVISTNIAESSVTIPDVVYVIESGKSKEVRYDFKKNQTALIEAWVSKASAKQRKGRAGRVQPGMCYSLYSSILFEEVFEDYSQPEILRAPLTDFVLQMKALGINDCVDYVSKCLTPPNLTSVEKSIE